ncbi:MBL fold metallo-hydrolase [Variovorax saccharolyticus]|uniref:MBL fold metallo-hydrolase n=1 Tax=Variovorax saccharolyticus TaxID=3053516 RepID=UPI002578296F|nr:MBL fold metallo-hydrolase [Variovorax sp. J31P216]MDM0026718.1 MBL fold metallo-hydrolase [Variovorax sp. J31P216]
MTRSAFTLPAAFRSGLAIALACGLAACASKSDDAGAVVARASTAMGGAQAGSLRYAAEGVGYTFGQAYKPGGAWPRITLHSFTRTIDYDKGAMRDEIVLSRAEPTGGGGYPLSGQQRNDQLLSGELAWNQTAAGAVPGPRFVSDRVHQLWITPHGALKAAARNNAQARRGPDGGSTLSFTEPGRFSATVQIGSDGLVTQVDSVFPDPVLGDTRTVTSYSDYRDVAGIKFPMRIRQTSGGFPVLDLTVKEVQTRVDTAPLQVPEAARNVAERVTAEKVAEGVWFLGGGSHNSVAIELRDHLVLVETPLNDARTQAVIGQAKALAPGKPIRFAVNSHAHFDHAGGVRTAVAEGATIVTQAASVPFFESAFAQANRVRPDRMAQEGKRLGTLAVGDKLAMGDASRPIELHRITDSVHSDSFLMVYLPNEKLLIQADAFTPGAPNTPPPAVPNANNLNLIANIERLGLKVDRILPLHGRVVPLSELYAAAGKPLPAR